MDRARKHLHWRTLYDLFNTKYCNATKKIMDNVLHKVSIIFFIEIFTVLILILISDKAIFHFSTRILNEFSSQYRFWANFHFLKRFPANFFSDLFLTNFHLRLNFEQILIPDLNFSQFSFLSEFSLLIILSKIFVFLFRLDFERISILDTILNGFSFPI